MLWQWAQLAPSSFVMQGSLKYAQFSSSTPHLHTVGRADRRDGWAQSLEMQKKTWEVS